MKLLLVALLVGFAIAIPSLDRVPTITLNQNRDFNGNPSISIAFPDGYTDNMIFAKSDDQELEENECIFMGHLEKETSACLAMTGCPGIEDVEFTIFSQHLERSGMMKWNMDGSVELINPSNPIIQNSAREQHEDQVEDNASMKTEYEECLDDTCDSDTDMGSTTASPTASTAKPTTPVMPKTMVMEYKVHLPTY